MQQFHHRESEGSEEYEAGSLYLLRNPAPAVLYSQLPQGKHQFRHRAVMWWPHETDRNPFRPPIPFFCDPIIPGDGRSRHVRIIFMCRGGVAS
jgi:hypothetical protein